MLREEFNCPKSIWTIKHYDSNGNIFREILGSKNKNYSLGDFDQIHVYYANLTPDLDCHDRTMQLVTITPYSGQNYLLNGVLRARKFLREIDFQEGNFLSKNAVLYEYLSGPKTSYDRIMHQVFGMQTDSYSIYFMKIKKIRKKWKLIKGLQLKANDRGEFKTIIFDNK